VFGAAGAALVERNWSRDAIMQKVLEKVYKVHEGDQGGFGPTGSTDPPKVRTLKLQVQPRHETSCSEIISHLFSFAHVW
jgi:hypothetical protein